MPTDCLGFLVYERRLWYGVRGCAVPCETTLSQRERELRGLPRLMVHPNLSPSTVPVLMAVVGVAFDASNDRGGAGAATNQMVVPKIPPRQTKPRVATSTAYSKSADSPSLPIP